MGQTPPAGGSLDLTSVREGSHTILIRHTDYQDYTQTVYVKGGSVVTVNPPISLQMHRRPCRTRPDR